MRSRPLMAVALSGCRCAPARRRSSSATQMDTTRHRSPVSVAIQELPAGPLTANGLPLTVTLRPGSQIFVVDAEGKNLHPLIAEPFDCAVPSWSRDGKSIYFSGNRDGECVRCGNTAWTPASIQMTNQGGFDPIESIDGKTVYYTRFYEPGIWKIPVGGGPETLVIPGRPQIGFWGHFAVSRRASFPRCRCPASPHHRIL